MNQNEPILRSFLSRREVIAGTTAAALSALLPSFALADDKKFTLPGPYRGKVVEVLHPGSVMDGKVKQEFVKQMVSEGICRLTGAKTEKEAWKTLVGPGDIVGIKGSPVGKPKSISQPETIKAVISGLILAGVPAENIVMFERYGEELFAAGFDKIIPAKSQIAYGARNYDDVQTGIEGYDEDNFVEFEKINPGADKNSVLSHRSHLSNVVSKKVTKIINIGAVKDHASAGITIALKNMSHGFSNNVSRTHTTNANNWCDIYIPTIVSMKTVREKVVLHIGDGLIGTYDGGPGVWNPHYRTWEYRSLLFATDPVALDRVGWEIIDQKRVSEKLPKVAETGAKATNPGHEAFDHRQPDHILIAGKMGLGESDLQKIKHLKYVLK